MRSSSLYVSKKCTVEFAHVGLYDPSAQKGTLNGNIIENGKRPDTNK